MGTAWSAVGPAWIANWGLLDFNFHTPLARSGVDVTLGTVPESKGGTAQTSYAVGDTLKVATANTITKLSGNATTTRKFRRQKGNGSAVTEDDWGALVAADLPSPTITSLAQLDASLCSGNQYIRNSSGTSWVCDSALLVTLSQISDSLCTAGKSVRRKASGSGWECFTAGSGGGGTEYSGGTGSSTLDNSDDSYFPISGLGYATGFGTQENVYLNVEKPGTLSNYACRASDTDISGSGSNGHTLTLVVGGPTALTCDVDGTHQTCEGTGLTEHVSGNDLTAYNKSVIKGSPTSNLKASCTFTFTPD
jgi:hypothetical protein